MARYSDEFRAQALVMLEAAGWPEKKGALTRTAKTLGIHYQTLQHWARREQVDPETQKILYEKTFDLKAALLAEAQAILGELPHARPDADFKELGTVLGIIVDKFQLLDGKATERVEILTPQERTDRLTKLLDTARNRRDGRATDIVQ